MIALPRSCKPHKPCKIAPNLIRLSIPSFPSELSQWLAPSAVLAVLGLILGLQGKRIDELRADLKASEARQQQDMKEFRAEMKEGFAQSRADLQASEARQREDSRALNEKLDRLVEALLTAKQS